MQRIINALIYYRNTFLYISLLGISLLFLNSKSKYHFNQLEKYGLYFSKNFYAIRYKVENYFVLKKINKTLLKENTILKKFKLRSNNIPLYSNSLKIEKRFPFEVKSANVIKNSFLNQQNYIIVDKGYDDGIKSEMAVISNLGIVGIVKSVSKHYSSVISILNQNLKINVRLKNNPAYGSLSWEGLNPKKFKVEDIVMNTKIFIGDTIITGGMSSYFPAGIVLGEVKNFDDNKQSGYYTINAELFEDPSQVYYVYIIENKDAKEINSLNKNLLK